MKGTILIDIYFNHLHVSVPHIIYFRSVLGHTCMKNQQDATHCIMQ